MMEEIATSVIKKKLVSCLIFLVFLFFGLHFCLAADSIVPGQSISGEQTLVSTGEIFELGFFSPGSSQNRYLAIWYKKVQPRTAVWVANRENPITDSSHGVLEFSSDGKLVVLSNSTTLWSTTNSVSAGSAKLLDSGNLVLIDGKDGNRGGFLWQSFDYPTDTYIVGMKLGRNLKTGLNWSLTSWRNSDDPSSGNFTLWMDLRGLPHFHILIGKNIYWSSGPWNGQRWSGILDMGIEYMRPYGLISNKDEVYVPDYTYTNSTIYYRVVMDKSGVLQLFTWDEERRIWRVFWVMPRDPCQFYGACGPFAVCNTDNILRCKCLQGFEPKNMQEWSVNNWSGGCVIRTELKCGEEDGFFRLVRMKLPVTTYAQADGSLSLDDCKSKCLRHCSCTAYANSDVRGSGSGCIVWTGALTDLQEFSNGGQELYLRVASSELGTVTNKRRALAIAIATPLFAMLVLVVCCRCCICKKNKSTKGEEAGEGEGSEQSSETLFGKFAIEHSSEFPLINFAIVEAATDNFSVANKLGEGGFGPVYKGKMPNGQEIAVKRLSKNSEQGRVEFENEAMLIAKLQHRNLVRLLGCCTHGEEKILIYEYMPNRSLDSFLFDQNRSALLDWKKRFNIIVGIARGILYLHEDSRLRIIHRDLKSSNILLDAEMSPKISDFGMARSFGRNQNEENTKNVVGTYGYMSPEYAIRGFFSEKSDVFSFGVLVLEIVSGKKSNGFYDESLSLIGYGWQLWKEGRVLEFVDPSLGNSCPMGEVLRCIHIGLLCVQESPGDRPNMSSIVFMLSSETELAPPEKPAFSILTEAELNSIRQKTCSSNNISITMIQGR